MPGSGRILLADDEQTFRESTGEPFTSPSRRVASVVRGPGPWPFGRGAAPSGVSHFLTRRRSPSVPAGLLARHGREATAAVAVS